MAEAAAEGKRSERHGVGEVLEERGAGARGGVLGGVELGEELGEDAGAADDAGDGEGDVGDALDLGGGDGTEKTARSSRVMAAATRARPAPMPYQVAPLPAMMV